MHFLPATFIDPVSFKVLRMQLRNADLQVAVKRGDPRRLRQVRAALQGRQERRLRAMVFSP
jgi:hypothetical protein